MSTLQPRNRKRDLLALVLLALTAFLALTLVTYDPADPPSKLVYPPRAEVSNACGHIGAVVARGLFNALGLGAYYLVVSLGVAAVVLLSNRSITDPWLRACGWSLSLVGLTSFVALALPGMSPGPVIGSGGYLGAVGRAALEMHFATAGAYILVASLVFGGLLLCTDYVLLGFSSLLIGTPVRQVGRGLAHLPGAVLGRRRKHPAGDGDDQEDDEQGNDDSTFSVRIRGRSVSSDTEDEHQEQTKQENEGETDECNQEEDKSEDEDEAAEQPAEKRPGSVRRLRVKALAGRKKNDVREEMIDQLNAANRDDQPADYELPSLDMLTEGEEIPFDEHEKEVRRKAKVLEKTFASFGFNVRVVEIETGPVIAQFEVELEAGLRLSRVASLADDLAIALRVPSVRIVAPIPGKNTVGIEVPNAERQLVRLREVIEEANGKAQKMRIPIFLGKDVAGNPMLVDLASLPHLLIAGRTGTGKSVCLNSIIVSMLMSRRPDEVRMLLIDPKMVELSPYKTLPHLMHPVVTDMRKAEAMLAWAVEKMEDRYSLLARAGVRHISAYNQLGEEELLERLQPENDEQRKEIPTHLPYIVIVADEMADLMMTAAKEVEGHIIRLAQKSRAVGIHLVLATQKPTVDVITGLIKSNLPARISFQVASRTDSRVVLDEMGADKLLGNGDLLFLWPGTSTLIRGQGTYVSDEEISRIVGFVGTTEPQFVKELVQLKASSPDGADADRFKTRDELYESAIEVVVREGRGSVSLLQRALGVGYGRGARLIDFMAEDGIVGPYNGSQAREVLVTPEQWEQMSGQAETPVAEAAPPRKRRSNKILLAPPDEDEDEEQEDPPFDTAAEISDDYEEADEETEEDDLEDPDTEYEDDHYEEEDEGNEYEEEDGEEEQEEDYRAESA